MKYILISLFLSTVVQASTKIPPHFVRDEEIVSTEMLMIAFQNGIITFTEPVTHKLQKKVFLYFKTLNQEYTTSHPGEGRIERQDCTPTLEEVVDAHLRGIFYINESLYQTLLCKVKKNA